MLIYYLSRKVKKDAKGLFIFYGGWRYRPSKKTKAFFNTEVLLQSPFHRSDNLAIVRIFGKNEIWKQTGKPKNEVPFFSKRIRLTDHCAGIRCSDSGYLHLVRKS